MTFALARADIAGVAPISTDAPKWVCADSFPNMDETPFGGFFYKNNPQLKNISAEKFFPFIDRYGQFVHGEWAGKIHSDSDFAARAAEEAAFAASLPPPPKRDKFGGFVGGDIKFKADGCFRTEKFKGKWYFVTPEGNLFWSLGVNGVARVNSTRVSGRERFFAADCSEKKYVERFPFDKLHSEFFNFYLKNVDIKYGGDRGKLFAQNLSRLRDWGVNTLGAWVEDEYAAAARMPYVLLLDISYPEFLKPSGSDKPLPDFFGEKFPEAMRLQAEKISARLGSPYCMGAFSGYKVWWQRRAYFSKLFTQVLSSPSGQPAKIAFAKILEAKYGKVENLNAAWGAQYASWENFLEVRDFVPKTAASAVDERALELAWTEKFYAVCRAALKAVSPRALYFGSRFEADISDVCPIAASRNVDVITFADYPRSLKNFKLPEGCADVPVVIGEFNFCAQDRGVFGGGHSPCRTTAEAAEKFSEFVGDALKNPQIAGVHWMRWGDTPASAKHNGENSASGLIDGCDTPIYPLVSAFKRASDSVYETRLNSR